MSVLRYYVRVPARIFTQTNTWYDFIFGNTKIKRREAVLKEWEQRETFQQLENILVR